METSVALAIGAFLVLVSVPAMGYLIRSSRLHTAARQAVGDLREARATAIATGWECRIVGFGNSSSNARRNQYRFMARRTSAVAWPADSSPVIKSSTQRVDPWMDVGTSFPGVNLDPGGTSADDRFEALFDSRGAATTSANDFAPFRVMGNGLNASITISSAGGITLQ